MSFDHPLVLLGFIVFIPIILYDCFSSGKKIQQNLPAFLRTKLIASQLFFRLFLACIIIAVAGPRWGIGQAADNRSRALDLVIAIDVSRSMEINDETNGLSRLERGLDIVREAVTAIPGARFAVAISRNRGIVAIPLTWDSGTALAFLDAAGPSLTGTGTNLESLVDAAAGAFQPSHLSTKVILLVSDGESLSGSLRAAIGRCKRDGITVTAVAVGSDEGRKVPGEDEIISRRDSDSMQMAARQTGGVYIDGNNENAAKTLAAHLRSLAPETNTGGNKKEGRPRWFIFALAAIIVYGMSKLSLLRVRNEK